MKKVTEKAIKEIEEAEFQLRMVRSGPLDTKFDVYSATKLMMRARATKDKYRGLEAATRLVTLLQNCEMRIKDAVNEEEG